MGLFDSIRRVVGGGGESTDAEEPATDAALIDTQELDVTALRQRAEGVASEVEQLDFSLASLEQFDAAIQAGYDEELATSDDPETYAKDVVRFGCYLGEVLVRVYGGRWERDPEWGVTVPGPDDEVTVAVFRVATRSITDEPVFAAVAEQVATELGIEPVDGAPVTPDRDDEKAESDGERDSDGDDAAAETDVADERDPEAEPDIGESEPDAGHDSGADDTATTGRPRKPDALKSGFGAVDEPDERASYEERDDEAGDVDDAPADSDDVSALVEEAEPEAPAADHEGETGGEATGADAPATDANASPDTDADESESLFSGTDDESDPTAGDGLRAEYAEQAESFVSFWNEHELDYTPVSLERLDELVAAEWDDERFDDATLGSDETFDDRAFTSVVTELGSYFGEVLVRDLDAEWSDETANDSVIVDGVDGQLAIPVFRVAETSLRKSPVFARSYDSLLGDLGRAD